MVVILAVTVLMAMLLPVRDNISSAEAAYFTTYVGSADIGGTGQSDDLYQLNAAADLEIASAGLPISADIDFGRLSNSINNPYGVTSDDLTNALSDDVGANPVWVTVVDGEATGYLPDNLTNISDALAGVGFELSGDQTPTSGDVGAIHVYLEFTVTSSDMAAVVGESTTSDFFDIADNNTARDAFFENFVFTKDFDGTTVDIVEAISSSPVLEGFPDFVVFERVTTEGSESVTVGLNFLLIDGEAPGDNPQILSQEAITNAGNSPSDLLLIYDGTKDGKFTDPVALNQPSSESSSSSSGGSGGCNAGFAPAAFLLAVPLFYLARRKK